ncbi:hypothetical protein D3C78_1878170 [compost metagenome]
MTDQTAGNGRTQYRVAVVHCPVIKAVLSPGKQITVQLAEIGLSRNCFEVIRIAGAHTLGESSQIFGRLVVCQAA